MTPQHFLKSTLVALATFNLVLPVRWAAAETPGTSTPASVAVPKSCDISLGQGGRLAGQVVDANGNPKFDLLVELEQGGQKVAQTKTDKQGKFSFDNVRGGACLIHVGGFVSSCRCWAAQIAPPSAKPEVLVISDPQLERGQRPFREVLTNPIVISLVIAAAIAIPVFVNNSQNNPSGS